MLVRLMQVPWAWNNRFIPSKNALLLLTKEIHPPFHLACLKYPNILLNTPPKNEGYVRCDSRSIFFLIPIHERELVMKKNPSRWNIRVFLGVLDRVAYHGGSSHFFGIGISWYQIQPVSVFFGRYCCTVSFGGNTFLRFRGNSFFEKFRGNSFFSSKGGQSVQRGGRGPPFLGKRGLPPIF